MISRLDTQAAIVHGLVHRLNNTFQHLAASRRSWCRCASAAAQLAKQQWYQPGVYTVHDNTLGNKNMKQLNLILSSMPTALPSQVLANLDVCLSSTHFMARSLSPRIQQSRPFWAIYSVAATLGALYFYPCETWHCWQSFNKHAMII